MYCKKCGLEIQEGAETRCPLCNMPLEESPAEQQVAPPDESVEDLRLKELISDIEGSVKQSLGDDEKSAQRNGHEVPFDPGNALEEELQVTPESGSDSDYEKTRAAMEQALASIEQQQLPAEIPPRRSAAKNAAAVVLVIGVVAAGIAAGYFFSVKEPQPRAPAVPAKKTPSQVPIAATPPVMARPVAPQQPEKPVTAESKPPASPAAQPAEPVKEQQAVAGAQPAQKEPGSPAAVPVKAADEQPPAVHPVPGSPPPAAEQKASEPLPKPPGQLQTSSAAAVVYCVNVGSFKMKESTERVCRDLKKNGYEPTIETVTLSDGNTWYRVTVGSFATRTEAAQFGRELESKTSIKPFVVKKK
jgi:cell division protein FtsN